MKKSVKIAIAVIVVLAIIAITCVVIMTKGGKKAITIEEFESKAKELGYIISELQNNNGENEEEVTNSKAAIKEDYSYLVMFYTLKDNDVASNYYNKAKEGYEKIKLDKIEPIEKNGKDYSTYALKSDGKYMYISRIKNTIIQFNVNESEEQEVKEFIKKLGY